MLNEILIEKPKTEAEIIKNGFLDKVTIDTINLLKSIFSNSDFKDIIVTVIS